MKYSVTPAEAAKMVRKIVEEKANALEEERLKCTFNAAMGEDIESARPDYSYEVTRKFLRKCDRDILIIKHAINVFNTTQKIGDMTIDQVLVCIPQLTEVKTRLQRMQKILPKQRASVLGMGTSSVIDYRYANFKVQNVKNDYDQVSGELRELQTALDKINTTAKIEFEIPD